MIGVESDRDSAANAVGAFHSCVWARTKPKPAARTAHRERPAHVGMHHEREPASEIGCMPIVACTRLQPREGKARVNVNRWQSMAITGTHVQSLAIREEPSSNCSWGGESFSVVISAGILDSSGAKLCIGFDDGKSALRCITDPNEIQQRR